MSTGPTGLQGQDGIQGVLGATGIGGLTGLTGWGGGPIPGVNGTGTFVLFPVSATTLAVTTASMGISYYITSPTLTTLVLPVSMAGITAGAFWVFQNDTGRALYLSLTNGTAVYMGAPAASILTVPSASGFTLVYTGAGQGYIVF